eukprot:m.35079 g.35079  ORF g.35079 m.35079 type:complete len:203 (+) comp32061_c0_seq1:266-874(+)
MPVKRKDCGFQGRQLRLSPSLFFWCCCSPNQAQKKSIAANLHRCFIVQNAAAVTFGAYVDKRLVTNSSVVLKAKDIDILFDVTVQPQSLTLNSSLNGTYFCSKVYGEDVEIIKGNRGLTCNGTAIKLTIAKDDANRAGICTCVLREGKHILSATVTLTDGSLVQRRVYLNESTTLICETAPADRLHVAVVWKRRPILTDSVC